MRKVVKEGSTGGDKVERTSSGWSWSQLTLRRSRLHLEWKEGWTGDLVTKGPFKCIPSFSLERSGYSTEEYTFVGRSFRDHVRR